MNTNPTTVAASSLALAVALSASAASAQTVITRTITAEPVETVVTQTPTGTIVTRRPVDTPVARGVAPAVVQPAVPAATVVETVPNTVDAITTREVVRRAEATRASRTLVTRQVSARTEPHISRSNVVHKTTRVTTTRAVPRLALTPRERQIVYQTIVEREVVPRREVIVAPSVAPAPYVATAPYVAPAPLIERPVGLPITSAPIVTADEDVVVQAPIAVGTVLPANVPLFALPQNIALSVPAIRSYSYVWLGGRAYLVDPATGVVVAHITE